ncbi:MAG: hypothetical protein COA80_09815 [Leeuwenhoekiella sp.]|nr:MAG: hypothetical protein COA80_09815 [Leeuwenhoekiella sp.]
MSTLRLGSVDAGKLPGDKGDFLRPYHRWMATRLRDREQFRDEANFQWQDFNELNGNLVFRLQRFLKNKGFFPNAELSGIFGYGTQAATRLFQEYVYSIEGEKSIGKPDGIVGPKTWGHIDRWESNGIINDWARHDASNPTEEFKLWFEILNKAKSHYSSHSNKILNDVSIYTKASDTYSPADWQFDPHKTHLIGIRRNADLSTSKRENDDLFVLLIKGLAFTFWGSTDPSASMADRSDEAFLVEGQHKYRLSWHKIASAQKIYKALRPYSKGVLVYRDKVADNALTDADIAAGLDEPNTTINIHWSGDGRTNFSAGCQVIAGRSYMDPAGRIISCKDYAAVSYDDLARGKTRGAYNVLSDLVVCYNKPNDDCVWYTLGREKNLTEINNTFPVNYLKKSLDELKNI